MKHWHATLIWFFCLGALLMTGYVPKKVEKVPVISSQIVEPAFDQSHDPYILRYESMFGKFELVLSVSQSMAILQIPLNKGEMWDESNDEYLILETERILNSYKPVRLGESGYNIQFESGIPMWDPYCLQIADNKYTCNKFANSWKQIGNNILIRGSTSSPSEYYPISISPSIARK